MLVELHIRDFAVIDRLHIAFRPGFNVLTGETGAGKSIVVDALQTVLGGRARSDLVRAGRDAALVEAVFELADDAPVKAVLEEMHVLDAEDPNTLVLRRDVFSNGRSRCRINGHLVTVAQLAAVGEHLVDIHGQHDHQSLTRPRTQLDLLDAYGGDAVLVLRRRFADVWRRLTESRRELARLLEDERERARRIDLVRFQLDEIAAAGLDPGEEEELEARRRRLQHLEKLQTETARLYAALHEGGDGAPAAADVLADAAYTLQALAQLDPQLSEAAQLLDGAAVQVREVAGVLRRYADQLEADPAALEEVQRRLAVISDLKRKYGATVAEVLAFAEELRAELDGLLAGEARTGELTAEIAALEKEAAALAAELSKARHDAAAALQDAVSAELEGLHMGPGRFVVQLERTPAEDGLALAGGRWAAGETGVDRVEFLLSANPGEPPRPLARVASGGELSRVALAVKRVLAAVDSVPTLVFDEVDAGIGGRTAQAVAQRLRAVAAARQVISVTHLAQLATMADHHLLVTKGAREGRTSVTVRPLAGEDRVEEIARMLAGVLTASTLDHARELLELAHGANPAS